MINLPLLGGALRAQELVCLLMTQLIIAFSELCEQASEKPCYVRLGSIMRVGWRRMS